MARSRNIKPSFFKNEDVAELDAMGRLLFIGLWTLADRQGLIEYRPKRIKVEIFPYDGDVEINRYLTVMSRLGLIKFVTDAENNTYVHIENFTKHQNPHHTESTSLPDLEKLKTLDIKELQKDTVNPPCKDGEYPADSLIPDSLIPDSLLTTAHSSKTDENAKQEKPKRKKHDYSEDFEEAWREYPKRSGDNPKVRAFKAWTARRKEGHQAGDLIAGVKRYNSFCVATGKVNTELVKQAATFFGPDCAFLELWNAPASTGPPQQNKQAALEARNQAAIDEWLNDSTGNTINGEATRDD